MQAAVLLSAVLHEVQQPGEAAGTDHMAEGSLVGPTVEEQEVGDRVKRTEFVLLQQAVDDLDADIVLVFAKDAAVNQLLGTAGQVVFGVEEAVPAGGHEVKPPSQGIVDQFVRIVCRFDHLAEL